MYRAVTFGVLALALVIGALSLVDQRRLWQRTSAWAYRYPEAAEPSDAAFGFKRAVTFVCALILLGLGCWMYLGGDPDGYSAGEVRATAVKAARALEHKYSAGDPVNQYDVQAALDDAGRYGELVATSGTTDTAGNTPFEITNRTGKHPVCLTITGAGHPESPGTVAGASPSTGGEARTASASASGAGAGTASGGGGGEARAPIRVWVVNGRC